MSTLPPAASSGSSPLLADLLQQQFDPASHEANNQQLYRLLRDAMLQEQLPPGLRLPSSRQLASELGVARNTVIHVYERLAAEGYVSAGVGQGTFVLDTRPDRLVGHDTAQPAAAPPALAAISGRGQALVAQAGAAERQWGAFMPGVPEVRTFPARIWMRLQNRQWRKPQPDLLTYAVGPGLPALRQQLADYLRSSRGVRCAPEQIIVTNGTHAAMQLVSLLLADSGDAAWVEDPGYWGVHSVWRSAGLNTLPVAVDEQGLKLDEGMRQGVPRLIYVSPSHQYPLGAVMSLARRRRLLAYARRHNCWIVEDDYDSEFRYGRPPLPSLQGLDAHGRVIYLATFSKVIYPGLRLAYMVVPEALVESFQTGLSELYRGGQYLTQAVLADFIAEGHFVAHIRRMRQLYARRRQALLTAIRQHFGERLPVHDGAAGLHLVLGLPQGSNDQALCEAAMAAGILTRPLSQYYRGPQPQPGLLLGYAHVDEADIARHFATLARVIRHGCGL
ncbi:PLP-dependent aminotransferase family protein [Vogesella sp. LIG4]|uniref:MocR-like pyridoxine biosynthesis transcription factor PdxR n=1 Tax=Vogesella sp. LIG4 TaxID=1192162 RepID=UPI00081F9D12|nr:PLP-dependent aminotransferase family protein [Vogesella sp. LIG4]SCK11486.1 GntR family transcriptional regulator / MocR family aminotransferase [Vogesella sp. LIG4]